MGIFPIILIAVGLAMDSFAVSIASGVILKRFKWSESGRIGLFMGIFQALMTLIGFLLASIFAKHIQDWDHWIAFVLLGYLGIRMMIEGFKPHEKRNFDPLKRSILIGLAFATSIDAAAVGISFAFLTINIWLAISIIGVVAAIFSIGGVWLGNKFSGSQKLRVEIIGGIILIAIGAKIVFEHLG